MTSIQIKSKYDRTNPYHIYYDLDAINLDTTGTQEPPILRFTEVRNNPYLDAPENYFLSVVRFAIQTPSLPVFIPIIQTGQPDVNLTIYSVSMSYIVGLNTITAQTYLTYSPENTFLPTPTAPLIQQDLSSEYYYLYSYQYLVKLVNTTIQTCYNSLNALVVAAGGVLPSPNAPFFDMNPNNFTMTLFADQLGYNESLVNPIKFFMNSAMYHLFNGFQANYLGYTGITFGRNYLFRINNSNTLNEFIMPTYTALLMYQEQSSISLWNPIQSLVFTTALLPVNETNVSAPKVFGSNTRLGQSNNNVNVAPIITDFEVPFSADNTYRPNVEYSPLSEYRLVDLYGASPISAIELTCYWKTQFGNLIPFILNSNCKANIKLLFRRKDFNVLNLNL